MGVTDLDMGVTPVFLEMGSAAKGASLEGMLELVGVTEMGVTLVLLEMGVATMGASLETVLVGMVVTLVEGVGVDLAASRTALDVDICSNRFLLDAMLACSLACANQNRIYASVNRT